MLSRHATAPAPPIRPGSTDPDRAAVGCYTRAAGLFARSFARLRRGAVACAAPIPAREPVPQLTAAEDPRGASDRELLDGLRTGSRAAFDAIFRQHYAPLVVSAGSILHDRSAAEDVVQDVMLELWRRRESLTIESTLRS